jgi:hypothetical protein
MTVEEVEQSIASRTTDQSGHVGSFTFKKSGTVAYLEARLDKSAGKSPALWRIVWDLHSRSDRGQEHRDTSPNLASLLARFGPVDIQSTPAESLEELLR